MKTIYIFVAGMILLILIVGASNITARQEFEYASLVLLPSTESVILKTPDQTLEANSLLSLISKLGYKTKLIFPPEYPIINHLAKDGWELVQISSDKESMSGAYVYWFKRTK